MTGSATEALMKLATGPESKAVRVPTRPVGPSGFVPGRTVTRGQDMTSHTDTASGSNPGAVTPTVMSRSVWVPPAAPLLGRGHIGQAEQKECHRLPPGYSQS